MRVYTTSKVIVPTIPHVYLTPKNQHLMIHCIPFWTSETSPLCTYVVCGICKHPAVASKYETKILDVKIV